MYSSVEKFPAYVVSVLKLSYIMSSFSELLAVQPNNKIETPNVKKRHKRLRSGAKNLDSGQDLGQ